MKSGHRHCFRHNQFPPQTLFGRIRRMLKALGAEPPQTFETPNDKTFMSPFLRTANEIFDSARGGDEDCRLAILVDDDGAIRMFADSDWDLGRLREHHAARAAYRITRIAGRVQLEARETGQSC